MTHTETSTDLLTYCASCDTYGDLFGCQPSPSGLPSVTHASNHGLKADHAHLLFRGETVSLTLTEEGEYVIVGDAGEGDGSTITYVVAPGQFLLFADANE